MQSTAQSRKNRAFCAVNCTKSEKSCVLCSQLHKVGKIMRFVQSTAQNLKRFVLSAIIWLSLPKNRPFLPITAKMQALFYFHSLFVVEFDYIRLLGIKQLSLSIGIGSSHIQMIPPFPRFRKALSNTLYFLISRRSGAALFLISNG